jgi:hypothetical protein
MRGPENPEPGEPMPDWFPCFILLCFAIPGFCLIGLLVKFGKWAFA